MFGQLLNAEMDPSDPNFFKTESADTRIYQICRKTANMCERDGVTFHAAAHPQAADLQPRMLVDAVFHVESTGSLELHNVAIRDGLCVDTNGDCPDPVACASCAMPTQSVVLEADATLTAGFSQVSSSGPYHSHDSPQDAHTEPHTAIVTVTVTTTLAPLK